MKYYCPEVPKDRNYNYEFCKKYIIYTYSEIAEKYTLMKFIGLFIYYSDDSYSRKLVDNINDALIQIRRANMRVPHGKLLSGAIEGRKIEILADCILTGMTDYQMYCIYGTCEYILDYEFSRCDRHSYGRCDCPSMLLPLWSEEPLNSLASYVRLPT